jgi:pimeloyl-ACP methyl ester carboxylesterase
MSRVSKQSTTIGILASATATLAAMTAYNIYRARKAEREHPPTGRFVIANGVRLHYIEKGEGPPVVLLHGNVVTAEDFKTSGVLDLLARRHRVIAFDRPGFGYSDRPHGSAWSARAQADLLRAAFVVLGIDHPVVLGHSLGASVALALALNHPQEVRGLVLVSGYYYPTLRADVLLSSPAAIPSWGISCVIRSHLCLAD